MSLLQCFREVLSEVKKLEDVVKKRIMTLADKYPSEDEHPLKDEITKAKSEVKQLRT